MQKGFASVKVVPPPAVNDGRFSATRTEPDHPWAQFAAASLQRSANAKPAIVPQSGGSICNGIFTDILGMPTIWIPHSYPSCSQHAPDEHILLSVTRSAAALMAGLYWDIGDGKAPAVRRDPHRNAASAAVAPPPMPKACLRHDEGGGKTRHELAPPTCTNRSAHVSRRS